MSKIKYITLVAFSVLIVTLETVSGPILWSTGVVIIQITYITWFLNVFVLFIWIKSIQYYINKDQIKSMRLLTLLMLWFVFSIFRGGFTADDYWTTKVLIHNTFGLLLPIVAYLLTNTKVLQLFLRFYIIYAFPLFFLFALIMPPDAYAGYLKLGIILVLFLPAFKTRMRWLVGIIVFISITADISARGNVLTFLIPLIIVVLYYFRQYISLKSWEFMRKVLMFVPMVLFALSVTGVFNVFKMSDYIEGDYTTETIKNGEIKSENLLTDTRSFLYEEVLLSAIKNDYWILGRTPARGNDTVLWEDQTSITGKNERSGNEAGILNFFTWTGLIGVILYFLVFYRATYLAINKSNNIYSKMIGVLLAFRWLWSWVTEMSAFELSFLSIWVLMAISFSKSFRSMRNKEVKYWVRGITDKQYLQHRIYIKE